jgi:hypothetical protein
LKQSAERTAQNLEPAIAKTAPADAAREVGQGFFTEGDNQTGEWKTQKGFTGLEVSGSASCGGCTTRQKTNAFRRWAELWNARLLNKEASENHDTGFLNFYSSALGYRSTKDPKYRDGALRAAARLKQLYNPTTELVRCVVGEW